MAKCIELKLNMSIVGIWRAKNPSIKKVCKKIMRMISYISCRLDLSRRRSWVSKNISRFRSSKEFKKVPKWVRRWIFFRMLLLQHKWNSCYSFTATWPLILGIKMRPIMYRNRVKKPFPYTMLQKISKCEVKAWPCWNLMILPPLRFCMKSHFGQFKLSKNVVFGNFRGFEFS